MGSHRKDASEIGKYTNPQEAGNKNHFQKVVDAGSLFITSPTEVISLMISMAM